MEHFSPIQIAALQTHDGHFSGCKICGNGNIMLVAVADGFDHLAVIPGIGGVGVGEQQHKVDFVVSNTGVDLLVTALLVRKQQSNGETRVVCDQTTGGSGGEKVMLHQNALVSGAELDHQFFLFIVSQKSDIHSKSLLSK